MNRWQPQGNRMASTGRAVSTHIQLNQLQERRACFSGVLPAGDGLHRTFLQS